MTDRRQFLWRLWLAFSLLLGSAFAAPQVDLDSVLAKLDQTSANFHAAQADFTWTTFNSVVNEAEKPQTGKIYFERSGSETKMAADLAPPDDEQVIFSEGKVQIYKPRLGTVDVYDAGAHREDFETFLVLGFGSSGTEMRKSFEVKYDSQEQIDEIDTAKLELVPKAENIRNHFPQIVLWIDLQRGVSVQQKLMESNGDYRLAKYSPIQLKPKLPAKVFKLNTRGSVKTITH